MKPVAFLIQGFGRAPSGRAIHCKSSQGSLHSLVIPPLSYRLPYCGLSVTIPHAGANLITWLVAASKLVIARTIPLLLLLISNTVVTAQATSTPAEQYKIAKSFIQQNDYENAIIVLKQAIVQEPNNIQYATELANAYYYKGDNELAKTTLNKVLDTENADEYAYLLAGNICAANTDPKGAEKAFKRGLKKYENSGVLYHALGDIMWKQGNYEAITLWEKGIQVEPNLANNYFSAVMYYYLTKSTSDKLWCLYYGEIFVNLESYSTRTVEVKSIILDCYKKIFAEGDYLTQKSKNYFETNFKKTLNKYRYVINNGINTPALVKLRAMFVLDWFANTSSTVNSSLYIKQQQMLKEGLFEAYNYWLFESAYDPIAYEQYVIMNKDKNNFFTKYQKNRVFKLTNEEYQKN